MRNIQSGSFRLGGYAGPVGNGHRGSSRKSPECFTGSAPPLSAIGLKLQKLALLTIPLAFLSCAEPVDNSNQGSKQGTTVATDKSRYAENTIAQYSSLCQTAVSTSISTQGITAYIEYIRNGHYNQLAVSPFNYTQSELTGYNNRMIQIGNDAISTFQKNNPGRSVASSIEIP